ncbi:exodeoxyribonuclease III [Algoriphagus zhangzhouensis]|uniref:Exodeoxyribonuclease-3 n=1 Tax=Algoriphagus zhangzhouensis TaxID=1073327 RepID=A0A1M7ZB37_9BACT|nr:exodeoxyribonuclease III [Algoriphagus zhangzhouensis]TDY46968.1 exodeoxyribonuclease-3 [Algoriphagus zhangzhouensis]SHO62073.1 exodeoxyribonuclease-3 [Algoriphagus zhangzhouensis]
MKIISYNVNGIRAAMKKGFVEWLKQENPYIIGIQELKADISQIDPSVFTDLGYELYWFSAVKKGYSGVAIFTKIKPKSVKIGMDLGKYDDEGRLIQAEFDNFSFLSAYFPSGTTGDIRQDFKYEFLDDIYGYMQDLRKDHPNLILSGDYNICHKAIDIHNPVSNKNSSGFLPDERAWMDKFTESGFIDTFRHFNKEPHNYSWWSYRAGARAKNLGWRIDYHMATEPLQNKLKSAVILPNVVHSDHCPIVLEIED